MVAEQLDALRLRSLYEWTFAIVVANLTVQFFRLLAQFTTLIFDLLKLSYGIDLFWPLTTDDLRPYTHYFKSQNEILYKLLESLILTATAIYGTRSLADFSVVGLILVSLVFSLHSSLLVLGVIFAGKLMCHLLTNQQPRPIDH